MLLDCCCMPDVARHEMDKSFESYRCFTVVGRKSIYYYLPKNYEKVFSYDRANVRRQSVNLKYNTYAGLMG